jgi:hypothetical protein
MGRQNDRGSSMEYRKKHLKLLQGSRLEQRAPAIFDHFAYGAGAFNSHVPQNWVGTETGAATPFAPGATGGTYAIGVTGATTNNAQELAGKGVLWTPSTMATNQRLVLEVRAKAVGATEPLDGDFTIGLADAVTYTNGLAYVVSAASALTTHAPTEFCGFYYSSIPTSGALFASGGNYIGAITSKAAVDTVTASSKVKDSSFHIYRIELDAAGNAAFYYDDEKVMSVAAAITAATALTPYIAGIAKASHALTVTLDYIFVGGDLV